MVIVITGPIASGKSTVARDLARELERTDLRVAVIDLDMLYGMLAGDGPKSDAATWTLARHAAAVLANTFLEEGVAVVIADGSFNTPSDRAVFAQHLHTSVGTIYVTLRVSFEEALRRARSDPTRGLSRDPGFLGPYFAAASRALVAVPVTDIVIDTERMTATSAAAAIANRVRSGASNWTRPRAEAQTSQALPTGYIRPHWRMAAWPRRRGGRRLLLNDARGDAKWSQRRPSGRNGWPSTDSTSEPRSARTRQSPRKGRAERGRHLASPGATLSGSGRW